MAGIQSSAAAEQEEENITCRDSAPHPDLGVNIWMAPEGAVCKKFDSISWSSFPINDNVLLCELPTWPSLQQLFRLQKLEPVGEF